MRVINQEAEILSPRNMDEGIQALRNIEYAGRNCYKSHKMMTEESYEKFITGLVKRGHLSPVEFADMTVRLTTSRAVLAELTRHRLASFAVQSQRYVKDDATGEISFIKPLFYQKDPELTSLWEASMTIAERSYHLMIEGGAKPQDARKVLPNDTSCDIVMKANLREWMHIFSLRTSPAAYPEMRELMNLLYKKTLEVFPAFVFENAVYKEENE